MPKSPWKISFALLLGIGALTRLEQLHAAGPTVARKPKTAVSETIPKGFRTVETAIKAKIRKTSGSQSQVVQVSYLGLNVGIIKKELAVQEVAISSPAQATGLQPGDVILQVAQNRPESAEEFREIVQRHLPGDQLELKVRRNGKFYQMAAKLIATSRPVTAGTPTRSSTSRRGVLGVNVSTSTSPKGVKITSVFRESAAAKAGIKRNDVVVSINSVATPDRTTLIRQLANKKAGDSISIKLLRDGDEKKPTAKNLKVVLGSSATNSGRSRTRPSSRRRYWTKSSYRLAVIGVEYPDVKHNKAISNDDWTRSFFSRDEYKRVNATGQIVFGSMNDYFHEVSARKFKVTGKVFDWVVVSKKREEYSTGSGTSRRQKSTFFNEVLAKLADREGRDVLSKYDGVVFLYAGGRYRTSRGGLYWPHRSSVSFRGQRMPYFICPEGGKRMQNISVFCHEFGHMLGLPDLYARPENPGSEGASIWCAMSNQSNYGRPQHYSAWCKERLEWVKPAIIDPRIKQKLILRPIENSATECFKVLVRADGSEYFLLENRRRTGFDKSLPSQGLLIWRVINGRPFLEESHGETGPRGPYVHRDLVPFPSKSNTAFTPFTTPSSRSKLGGGWPVHITNIRQLPDGRISFYVGYEFN